MSGVITDAAAGVRADVWLWAARFFKTRALAKQAIETGKLGIDGQPVAKPSRLVRCGQRLRVERAGEVFEIEVLALAELRGPASVAQTLYRESPESAAARAAERERRRYENAGFQAPAHRPDKRSRRQLSAVKKDDGLPPWWPRGG